MRPPANARIRLIAPEGAPPGHTVYEFIGNYPRSWLRHYFASEFAGADVTFLAAGSSMLPFRWDRLRQERPLNVRQIQVFDEAGEFGIGNGVTVPIHGPQCGLATLNFFNDLTPAAFDSIWRAHHDDFLRLGIYTHQAILGIVEDQREDEEVRLTAREEDCLLWTSRGKTAWEAAQILGISDQTVVFHLNNAAKKLGVFSKHQAVVKAIVGGLIVP